MEPGGSMPHSQVLSDNPCPEPNLPNINCIDTYFFKILLMSSDLRLGLPKGLFPVGVPTYILKALLLSSILTT